MRPPLSRVLRSLAVLWMCGALGACAPAASARTPLPTAWPSDPAAAATASLPPSSATSTPSGTSAMPPFPECTGMQKLDQAVQFDWPNLKTSMEQFIASAWEYHSCAQPPAEVAKLYRAALPNDPYKLWDSNWLEREQGTLGIYFSQSGLWYYVWFLPKPGDARGSYIILAESFASVEC